MVFGGACVRACVCHPLPPNPLHTKNTCAQASLAWPAPWAPWWCSTSRRYLRSKRATSYHAQPPTLTPTPLADTHNLTPTYKYTYRTHTNTHTHTTHTHAQTHTHTRKHAHTHVNTHTHAHTRTHTRTRTHTHTQTRAGTTWCAAALWAPPSSGPAAAPAPASACSAMSSWWCRARRATTPASS